MHLPRRLKLLNDSRHPPFRLSEGITMSEALADPASASNGSLAGE